MTNKFGKRNSKYNAKKTEVDGIVFDSKKEANRYCELKLLEKAGDIDKLELQPSFICMVNRKTICTYKADFKYWDCNSLSEQMWVYEDVKGMKTPVYKLKKKLVEALYNIKITEI